ncbi:pectinesterase/pectinesterase inhibitor U1 [Artemisia annua]|uniref:Pectinesterase/pectinesterase inhibitor U1 n=1 Tax=Artemisia annua TaxID=35608 RepID=A0A2U1NYJ4_ARTAN|nr:pectinesterase/pectinesterase inhibitor U1 [Artemisia annua]
MEFGDESEQKRAMNEMNGRLFSTRPMRIGPATNKKNMVTQQYAKASHPEVSTKVKTQKDAIELAVNMTTKAIQHSYFKIQKLTNRRGLTPCQIRALNDSLEIVSETLDKLGQVMKGLEEYDTKKSLKQHVEDL